MVPGPNCCEVAFSSLALRKEEVPLRSSSLVPLVTALLLVPVFAPVQSPVFRNFELILMVRTNPINANHSLPYKMIGCYRYCCETHDRYARFFLGSGSFGAVVPFH